MTAALTRIKHPRWASWLAWDFGTRRTLIGGCVQSLLYFTDLNRGGVWFLALDIAPANTKDKEPLSQHQNRGGWHRIPAESYFPSPVETPQPPPIEPPPVVIPEPPVVEPPPVTPPVTPPNGEPVEPPPVVVPTPQTYKIKTITRTKAFPTVVFFGVASGLPGKLVSPGGFRVQPFTTGNKPEYGAGGTEAGAGVIAGDHTLIIGNDTFTVAVDGEFTKIEFEAVTVTSPDAAICTGFMDLSKAQRVLAAANEIARRVVGQDIFRIEK